VFSLSPPIIAVLASPFIGSFIGSIAIRLPDGRSIVRGRSTCDHCCAKLRFFELIPILSWLLLRGHCRACRQSINPIHPAAEILAVILAVWAGLAVLAPVLWVSVLLGWALLVIALVDFRRHIIPDALSIPLMGTGLVVAAVLDWEAIGDHVIGAVAGFLFLWLVSVAYSRVRGGKGMGGGDPKLLAAIGAWVTWHGLPAVLLYASLSGLIHATALTFLGDSITMKTRLPFGPHLAIGGWLVWLYGPLVIG